MDGTDDQMNGLRIAQDVSLAQRRMQYTFEAEQQRGGSCFDEIRAEAMRRIIVREQAKSRRPLYQFELAFGTVVTAALILAALAFILYVRPPLILAVVTLGLSSLTATAAIMFHANRSDEEAEKE